MRAALVSPRYPPAVGGVEQHVQALAQGLSRRGIDVEVITTDPSGELPPIQQRDGVLVRRFPTLGGDAVYLLAPRLGVWLARHARRFDVIHAHSYHSPLALQASLASQLCGVPFVLTPHYHGTGHSRFRRWLHQPYRVIGKRMARSARRVICVSAAEQRLVERDFGTSIRSSVAPNGVDAEEIEAAPAVHRQPGRKLIFSAGRLEFYKQAEKLIEALRWLPASYDVAIAGQGPARAGLERVAKQLDLGTRVRLLGQVGRPELLSWYRSADVFVSLSLHEAFGITLLEAAAAGAALVVSDIPAHCELAGYLPAGRMFAVQAGCSPEVVANAVTNAMQRSPAETSLSGLPSWDAAVMAALECYAAVTGLEQHH